MAASRPLTVIGLSNHKVVDFAPYVASINEAGIVAYQAREADGATVILTGDGERSAEAARSDSDGAGAGFCSHPDINGAGELCIYNESAISQSQVRRFRRGLDETLAASGQAFQAIGPLGPTMNDRGVVAFRARIDRQVHGIFVCDDSGMAEVANTAGRFTAFYGLPVINNQGTVIFRGDEMGGVQGVFAWRDGALATLAATGGDIHEFGAFPTLSEDGAVAVIAKFGSGQHGILEISDGVKCLLETTGMVESLRGALLKKGGLAAFYGTPAGGRLSVLSATGSNIVSIGDVVLGARVMEFAQNPVSVNEAGQIAIRLALDDGRQAIVRYEPEL